MCTLYCLAWKNMRNRSESYHCRKGVKCMPYKNYSCKKKCKQRASEKNNIINRKTHVCEQRDKKNWRE